jgi:hypothetical protein
MSYLNSRWNYNLIPIAPERLRLATRVHLLGYEYRLHLPK